MTLDELTPWLFSRTSGGVNWGLERTERLLAGVGDPHRLFRSVLIGGTNGKGSVASLCDSALRAAGVHRIGLYTSPHLVSFTERVRIDGKPVAADVLADAALRLRASIEETDASFFEATTAMAFLVFAEAGVELAVVEVGLGGRLDSTNVLSPLVTGVTNVALDHTEYLGGTIEAIAYEKAGIFESGVPALVGEEGEVALAVLRGRARAVGAPFHRLDDMTTVKGIRTGPTGTRLEIRSTRWGERELRVALPGTHQARNAAFASELLGLLPPDVAPEWEAVSSGFESARWAGRLQVERIRGTTWVLDVAHNPAGARALAQAMAALEIPRPLVAVVGILKDKEWKEMLRPLAGVADQLVLTTPDSAPASRRWDPGEAESWCRRELGVQPRVIPSLASSLERAATLAPHGTVLVTGSVHTVGDAMQILELRSW